MDKLLVEHVADALMEYIPSRTDNHFDPNDPGSYKWARAIALNCAEAAINAVNSYKESADD